VTRRRRAAATVLVWSVLVIVGGVVWALAIVGAITLLDR
jgi:hypothetical protein